MKQTVLKYGLISGGFFALTMIIMAFVMKSNNFEATEVMGYTIMVIAFIFVYLSMVSYRNNIGDGYISFGRSISVGLLVVLISSVCYVIAWMIIYYTMIPDFIDRYVAHIREGMIRSGKTAAQMDQAMKEMQMYKDFYKTPWGVAAITFLEPLPVGVVVTLISAIIMVIRNKKKTSQTA